MDKKEKGTVAFSSSRYWDETYTPRGSSIYPWVYDNKSNLYQYVESYKTLLGNTDKVSEVSLASGMGDGSGDETENRCASGNVRAGSEVIGVRMHGTYACPDRKGTRRG